MAVASPRRHGNAPASAQCHAAPQHPAAATGTPAAELRFTTAVSEPLRRLADGKKGDRHVSAVHRMRPSKPGAWCTALAVFMPRMRTITPARTPRGGEIVVSVALRQQPAEFVRLRGNQPLGREFALSE
jgi:hypothetical protein